MGPHGVAAAGPVQIARLQGAHMLGAVLFDAPGMAATRLPAIPLPRGPILIEGGGV